MNETSKCGTKQRDSIMFFSLNLQVKREIRPSWGWGGMLWSTTCHIDPWVCFCAQVSVCVMVVMWVDRWVGESPTKRLVWESLCIPLVNPLSWVQAPPTSCFFSHRSSLCFQNSSLSFSHTFKNFHIHKSIHPTHLIPVDENEEEAVRSASRRATAASLLVPIVCAGCDRPGAKGENSERKRLVTKHQRRGGGGVDREEERGGSFRSDRGLVRVLRFRFPGPQTL